MRAVSQTQMSRALPCCKPAEFSYSRIRISTVRTRMDVRAQGDRPSRAAPSSSLDRGHLGQSPSRKAGPNQERAAPKDATSGFPLGCLCLYIGRKIGKRSLAIELMIGYLMNIALDLWRLVVTRVPGYFFMSIRLESLSKASRADFATFDIRHRQS